MMLKQRKESDMSTQIGWDYYFKLILLFKPSLTNFRSHSSYIPDELYSDMVLMPQIEFIRFGCNDGENLCPLF